MKEDGTNPAPAADVLHHRQPPPPVATTVPTRPNSAPKVSYRTALQTQKIHSDTVILLHVRPTSVLYGDDWAPSTSLLMTKSSSRSSKMSSILLSLLNQRVSRGGGGGGWDARSSKNPPVKTLLAIGGWNAGGRVAREYGFDGIDLDWEFPQDSQDMTNLSQLLEEFRAHVNKEEQETGNCRGPNRGYKFPSGRTPVNSINANLDWVNVMCYNYCGNWDTITLRKPVPTPLGPTRTVCQRDLRTSRGSTPGYVRPSWSWVCHCTGIVGS
ncbi:hypothetical protein Vadar_025202 [Vaccinium darrowii]|uniref:Uncharacterized protein n=1 Tax=Vaccinium darrowii TaxID=229202 RepID=A0ACB7Z6M0_9ERIC|nr:hypothetical protein Vadar_025202 [Vaccinium darrowii]